MQALPSGTHHPATVYLNSGGNYACRPLPYWWPGCQYWDGVSEISREPSSRADLAEPKPDAALMQSQCGLASIARLQEQCGGYQQPAQLPVMVPQSPGQAGARGAAGQKIGVTRPGPFSLHGAAISNGSVPLELNVPYDMSVRKTTNVSQQLPIEYWQQTLAVAAVRQAAAAGQVPGTVPLYGAGSNLASFALCTSGSAPPAPVVSMIPDDKELKRQRRKLSNRESARRSRLRKQSELQAMLNDVRKYTVQNVCMKLKLRHLRQCFAELKQQNAQLEAMIQDVQSFVNKGPPTGQLRDDVIPEVDQALDCSGNVVLQLPPADSDCPLISQRSESMSSFDEGIESLHNTGLQCGHGHLVGPDVQELVSA